MDPLQTSTDADATDDATDATESTGVICVTGGYGGTVSTLRCSVPDRNRSLVKTTRGPHQALLVPRQACSRSPDTFKTALDRRAPQSRCVEGDEVSVPRSSSFMLMYEFKSYGDKSDSNPIFISCVPTLCMKSPDHYQ